MKIPGFRKDAERECWGDSNIRVQRGVLSTLVLEVGGKGGSARVIKRTVMRLLFVLSGPLKEAVTRHPWAIIWEKNCYFLSSRQRSWKLLVCHCRRVIMSPK